MTRRTSSIRRAARVRSAVDHTCEHLEPRRLLAVIILDGTDGNDTISITMNAAGNEFTTDVNGQIQVIPLNNVDSITVNAKAGTDSIEIIKSFRPVTVNGEAGTDIVQIGSPTAGINDVTSPGVTFDGGADVDRAVMRDSANTLTAGQTYVVTSTAFRREQATRLTYANIERLDLQGGSGDNGLQLISTAPGVTYNLALGPGLDSAVTGGQASLNNVEANFPASSTVNIDGQTGVGGLLSIGDTDSTSTNDYVLTGSQFYKRQAGAGPRVSAQINFVAFASATINCTDSGSYLLCDSIPAGRPTTFNLNGGDDTISFTNSSNDLSNLAAPTTVNGGAGSDDMLLNDSSSADNDNTTITSTTISQPDVSTITWNGELENAFMYCATGNNGFYVDSLSATQSIAFKEGAGSDFVWLAAATGDLDAIAGSVDFDGGAGTNGVYLDDDNTVQTDAYLLGASTFDRSSFGSLIYAGISVFELYAEFGGNIITVAGAAAGVAYNIYANDGDDSFIVGTGGGNLAAGATLNLFGQGNWDSLQLTAGDLALVASAVSFDGGVGNDAISLNDQTGTGSTTCTINTTTVTHSGFGGLSYSNAEAMTLNPRASGSVTVVNGVPQLCPVIVNGGASVDQFLMGVTGGLSQIRSQVTWNGGGGTDTATIQDLPTNTENYGITSSTLLRGLIFGGFAYNNIEALTLNASVGANNIGVASTSPNTPVTINSGNGPDNVIVNQTNPNAPVTLRGVAGDNVTVNDSTVIFDETLITPNSLGISGSTARLAAGENRLLRILVVDGNSFFVSGGVLDLNDNDMLLDYPTTAQLASVQSMINSARNGGQWNGSGITSTAAKNALPKITTLGAMRSSDYPGGTFNGQTLDSSMVLVKYTYYGDTDFNGVVNFDDYSRTDAGFNNNRTGWVNGDFDANGNVNFDDYSLIDLAFNIGGPPLRPGSGVPGSARRA